MTTRSVHFMVDVETTGLRPDIHAMIQIGAVEFDPFSSRISTHVFNEALAKPAWRKWNAQTREWWTSDKERLEILESLERRAKDPTCVMRAFRDWVSEKLVQDGDFPIFWAKPSHFDYSFVESYFVECGVESPFHYRNVRDMRSFLAGMSDKPVELDPVRVGKLHDATDDATTQVIQLQRAIHAWK